MVLAFKAYLQVGEMVPRSRCMVSGCLSLGDVLLSGVLITISFRRFKHSAQQGPLSLQFSGEGMSVRGVVPAPLFAYPDGLPMLRVEFDASAAALLWVRHQCI